MLLFEQIFVSPTKDKTKNTVAHSIILFFSMSLYDSIFPVLGFFFVCLFRVRRKKRWSTTAAAHINPGASVFAGGSIKVFQFVNPA